MKAFLFTLFCLIALTSAHAQAWPRNSTTDKVEFHGTLPWPASAKTEAQRRALVRRWCLRKLTDDTPAEVEAHAATNRTNGLLTYSELPKAALLRYGSGDNAQFLSYFVLLFPSGRGLNIKFSRFDLALAASVEEGGEFPLELVLASPTPAQQVALAALRKRLAVALASW